MQLRETCARRPVSESVFSVGRGGIREEEKEEEVYGSERDIDST